MRILPGSPEAIAEAAAVIRSGGIVAYPTDTLYGLAVDPRNAAAVRRLFEAKGRDASTAIPLIAASLEQAQQAGRFSMRHSKLAEAFWPGPLTIVVPARDSIQPLLLAGGQTVAIRVPAHPIAVALAARHEFCITSTSANRSGQSPASDAAAIAASAGLDIELLIDGGPTPGGPPSTIVAIDEQGPRLIRAGAVAWERVLESLE